MSDLLRTVRAGLRTIRAASFTCDTDAGLLIKAATLGRFSTVESLLAGGTDANVRYGTDRTSVLHLVGMTRRAVDLDVIDLLLSAGADIDAATTEGCTPLHSAACCPGLSDALALFLQRGAAKDAVDDKGRSALHFAAESGHINATRTLLAAGADATLRADNGAFKPSPLDIAAWLGRMDLVGELLRHGMDVNAAPKDKGTVVGFTALHHAAMCDRAGVAEALLEAGASTTARASFTSETPLETAVVHVSVKVVRVLLRHGVPESVFLLGDEVPASNMGDEEPPLHPAVAARKACLDGVTAKAVGHLLEWGADETALNADGKPDAEVIEGNDSEEEEEQEQEQKQEQERQLLWITRSDLVRVLLANAEAGRAWRRRGLLLLCVSRKIILNRRRRSRRERKRKRKRRQEIAASIGGGAGGERGWGGDLDHVVASLLEIEDEEVFQRIVGCL